MKTQTQYLDISTSTILKFLMLVAFTYIVFILRDVIILLIISFIVSSGVSISAKYLQKQYHISYSIGVTGILLLVVGVIVLLISILVPALIREYATLVRNFPQLVNQLDVFIASIVNQPIDSVRTLLPDNANVGNIVRTVSYGFFFTTENIFARIIDMTFLATTSLILSFQPRRFDDLIVIFFPKKMNRMLRARIQKARKKVGSWLLGQIILSFIVGASSYIVFIVLGVPYALLLAMISGILNVIPMIGPVLSLFPAVVFALFNSLQTALGVTVFYTILQQLDGNILTPLVMHKVTGINTIVIIFSVLVGVSFAGFLGALIAVPVVSVISIFVSDLTYTTKNPEIT